jgi:hypothetical protein
MGASNSTLFQIDTSVPKMLLFKSDLSKPFVDASEFVDSPPLRRVPVHKLGEYSLAILKPGKESKCSCRSVRCNRHVAFWRRCQEFWFFFFFLFFFLLPIFTAFVDVSSYVCAVTSIDAVELEFSLECRTFGCNAYAVVWVSVQSSKAGCGPVRQQSIDSSILNFLTFLFSSSLVKESIAVPSLAPVGNAFALCFACVLARLSPRFVSPSCVVHRPTASLVLLPLVVSMFARSTSGVSRSSSLPRKHASATGPISLRPLLC